MQRWLKLSTYNAFVLFLAMGVSAALFAWNSANLIHLAMENFRFIREFRGMAIMDGGLLQLREITACGYLALIFFLVFKACEIELVYRWRNYRAEKD
jgi:hypothetical protein